MPSRISPLAGKPPVASALVDLSKLITAYYTHVPDPADPAQRVAFGTSGHRGSSFDSAFNEWHILATTQAICDYRRAQGISGPLFLGIDTHALSQPAYASALQVLAANGVDVMIATDQYTPTPALSHAILTYNQGRDAGLADGIVVTPSHNPPDSGGFKYNPPNGGPAGKEVTDVVQAAANQYLADRLEGVKRWSYARAVNASTTHEHDFMGRYVDDLGQVIDMDVIRGADVRMGVDPLGGAGVQYWSRIADQYRLNLTVVSDVVDGTFRFMTQDWDGAIRMDPSSAYAMQGLLAIRDDFDIAFASDTDHDRHGIITPKAGLLTPNQYLPVAIEYLFSNRPEWSERAAIGKTIVSTSLIDHVARKLGRSLYEVPVGFKWFSDGLLDGSLGFGGEESAGATFLRRDGSVWTTDKDGIVPALLSGEITARTGQDPGERYRALAEECGTPLNARVEAGASAAQKKRLSALAPDRITAQTLAGDAITQVTGHAPANGAAIGGIKVSSDRGWFAARPSGTEDIYKIYAESFNGQAHLDRILEEAQAIVDDAIKG